MKYAPISHGPKELEPFYELPPKVQSDALGLAITYMQTIERVNCPICRANDTKEYNGKNEACVQCWYKHLVRMAEGVARDAERSHERA